eukprot:CAMPEP_0175601670 /NCGR_PEP_ID=MMETSP0096-20121207/58239_1 /TAXON_ID=311494 /ORGANISM="Alexandrium monilatum, Strain CCMP3105" /LENGTH=81 /DNA_ID=CAMNT_0016906315 /DNA_START=71 /DNA_END=311 /DNA_ORIENTATION=-
MMRKHLKRGVVALSKVGEAGGLQHQLDQTLELLILLWPESLEFRRCGTPEPVVGDPLLHVPTAKPRINIFCIPAAWAREER